MSFGTFLIWNIFVRRRQMLVRESYVNLLTWNFYALIVDCGNACLLPKDFLASSEACPWSNTSLEYLIPNIARLLISVYLHCIRFLSLCLQS